MKVKNSLRRRIAEKIYRSSGYSDFYESLFDSDDQEMKRMAKYYLNIASNIIRMVKKEVT